MVANEMANLKIVEIVHPLWIHKFFQAISEEAQSISMNLANKSPALDPIPTPLAVQ